LTTKKYFEEKRNQTQKKQGARIFLQILRRKRKMKRI